MKAYDDHPDTPSLGGSFQRDLLQATVDRPSRVPSTKRIEVKRYLADVAVASRYVLFLTRA